MSWSERVVFREGVRISCRDWGDPGGSRPAVVLLHGLAGHAGEWDAVARELSPRHRVVAVDQRGHGASERRPADVSRAAYVADTVAVCERLGLREPVLAGQSLGGHTAMLAAAAHPGLFRGLVLVEAGPGGPGPDVPAEIGGWLDSWPTPFPSREAAVGFLGGGPVGEGWAAGLEERDGGWWPRFERDVMVGSLAENARRAFWDEWSQVSCPTLAVFAQSGFIAPGEIDEMLRLRPRTTALSVPGTGHDVHLERPDVLLEALRGFLGDLSPAAGAGSPGAGRSPAAR
ncbi:alpha/beta hydrolase [Streptomyces sp. WAC07149]|uniref:alpha/beta fold hydrolase n=1 Tax=Streptomyces sp. WAC07149 TaxID=2487425 RepID=UPI000F7B6966|nr:alpha/beta hydrolase [Streptomyces sp. WAC07149]RST08251.1 alpha/beta hydrolase [Streptomyces sp. WAC07149]